MAFCNLLHTPHHHVQQNTNRKSHKHCHPQFTKLWTRKFSVISIQQLTKCRKSVSCYGRYLIPIRMLLVSTYCLCNAHCCALFEFRGRYELTEHQKTSTVQYVVLLKLLQPCTDIWFDHHMYFFVLYLICFLLLERPLSFEWILLICLVNLPKNYILIMLSRQPRYTVASIINLY